MGETGITKAALQALEDKNARLFRYCELSEHEIVLNALWEKIFELSSEGEEVSGRESRGGVGVNLGNPRGVISGE